MKKTIYSLSVLFLSLLLFVGANGQSVTETQVKYQKERVNGFVGSYNLGKKDLQKVANDYFSKNITGKSSKDNGYTKYNRAYWSVTRTNQSDVYYKVDGNKNKGTLTVLVTDGNGRFVSSQSSPETSVAIKNFLGNLVDNVDSYSLNQDIESRKKDLSKLEKKQEKALKSEKKMKSQVEKLQKKIEKNKTDYETQATEIEKVKKELEDLRAQN